MKRPSAPWRPGGSRSKHLMPVTFLPEHHAYLTPVWQIAGSFRSCPISSVGHRSRRLDASKGG
jgi:hypothetical protein